MTGKGSVTLVGAGPGDPGLMTLAGRDALAAAEVVLYDRLAAPGLLALAPPGALKIDVGKNKGDHPVPQSDINRLLLAHALAGRRVVRLKGGDPYLFGRGAEELELLRDNGVPFRVIPGVSSALAAPAYAGIPVTHRDYASSVHILTGHGKEGRPPDIAYPELARSRGTLVFLMAVSTLPDICGGLLAAGMAPDTPAALVEKGTLPGQRRLLATLADLPGRAAAENFASPAVTVIGKVCALAERFDWTAHLPLWGREILAICSQTTASRLAVRLRQLGCGVDECVGVRRTPLPQPDGFWPAVPGYSWLVLTSPYGADLFFDGLAGHGMDARSLSGVKLAVVGSRTAETVRARGVIPDFVPPEFSSRALARGLGELLRADDRVLLFRARDGEEDLPAMLRERSIAHTETVAYATESLAEFGQELGEKIAAGRYDALAFTSASGVEAFVAALAGKEAPNLPALCIGEITAAAARRAGLRVEVARRADIGGMVELAVEYLRR